MWSLFLLCRSVSRPYLCSLNGKTYYANLISLHHSLLIKHKTTWANADVEGSGWGKVGIVDGNGAILIKAFWVTNVNVTSCRMNAQCPIVLQGGSIYDNSNHYKQKKS